MKIEIGDYIVSGDGVCVSIQKRQIVKEGKNKGAEFIQKIGHYADIDQALQRVLSEKITADWIRDAESLKNAIKAARAEISTAARRLYLRGVAK